MSIVIHGMPASVCTRRVMAVLEELEVPYKIKVVDVLSGMNNTPEHLARQPFGKIPIIVMDDDLVLYESRAISKYLCTKYPEKASKLTVDPTDARAFAIYEQLLSVEVTTFDPAAKDLVSEKLFKKFRGEFVDEAKVARHRADLGAILDVYESRLLATSKYLAGDEFTLADLFHLSWGELLSAAGETDLIDSRPNVKRWWDSIHQRRAWQTVLGRRE
ncbi:hypothetical protein CI102_5301 [Trichoderma harzianum]|uniref:glutathione transferase n=1 Tax=Trichoderma harzianum CBS 226.95 TaxID=983964 RepID=A0A2T3ZSG2_TRIHA|nr:hypothetical protein M431DRAFT_549867 [Trichoderma harzianum CBS 226.95]PKK50312.1 hypothetical protein CI102_5301 [Trichoderma harzianum]PTB47721.1 hypothetical protein M431DRAFT_549867 [Trichoderma harzianum CBS 226.95]